MFSSLDFQLNLNYLVYTSNSLITATEPLFYPAALAMTPYPFAHQFILNFQPVDLYAYVFKFSPCQPLSFQTLLFPFQNRLATPFFISYVSLYVLFYTTLCQLHTIPSTKSTFALSIFDSSWSFHSPTPITNIHPPPSGLNLTPHHQKLKKQDIQKQKDHC